MCRARSCSCSSAQTPMTSPSSVASSPSSGAKPGGWFLWLSSRAAGAEAALGSWLIVALSLADGVVFAGFLVSDVCKGLALFLG
jgi:hypothetical protein